MYNAYLKFFKADGLLALAGWPHAAGKDFTHFWAERFCVPVHQELVSILFPFLPTLRKQVADLGKRATGSMLALPKVLSYLGVVVVQDALELAEEFPSNPVHKLLLRQPLFRCVVVCNSSCLSWRLHSRHILVDHAGMLCYCLYAYQLCLCVFCSDLLRDYKQQKAGGVFEPYRPRTTKDWVIHLCGMVGGQHRAGAPFAAYSDGQEQRSLELVDEAEARHAHNLDILARAAGDAANAEQAGQEPAPEALLGVCQTIDVWCFCCVAAAATAWLAAG
jgi:hypothetical protein